MNEKAEGQMREWLRKHPRAAVLPCYPDATLITTLEDAYRVGSKQGHEEGATDKAAAVQAEHEAMLADAEAAVKGYTDRGSRGIGEYARTYLWEGMCMRLKLNYKARTNPPSDKVTVTMKMPRSSYETIDWKYWKAELLTGEVDPPPGETETSDTKEKT